MVQMAAGGGFSLATVVSLRVSGRGGGGTSGSTAASPRPSPRGRSSRRPSEVTVDAKREELLAGLDEKSRQATLLKEQEERRRDFIRAKRPSGRLRCGGWETQWKRQQYFLEVES